MTELMGEAAERVYWSLSALIQSHRGGKEKFKEYDDSVRN